MYVLALVNLKAGKVELAVDGKILISESFPNLERYTNDQIREICIETALKAKYELLGFHVIE